MRIVLVRHAPTAWSGRRYCGRSDPPLTRAGRRAAWDLAAHLAGDLAPRTRVVSSPSLRAVETATAIAAAMGDRSALELDDRRLENDVGLAEGRRFDDLAIAYPQLAASILAGSTSIDWPGGETAEALEARVRSAWDEVIAAGRDAVVVTHAGPL